MKHLVLMFLFCLFLLSPIYAMIYHYEIEGEITYSDFDKAYGYDPFIDVGNTTFRLSGMWGDLGTENYITINEETYNTEWTDLFIPFNNISGDDILYYRSRISSPLGIWHVVGQDHSGMIISDDGSVNWDMFSDLDWQIYWIAVVHDDPTLPKYWEYDGTITSASVTTLPVPEPATALLYGIGMVFLVGSRLKRKMFSRWRLQ